MQRILINISGELVVVESDWSAILDILRKDFWSFLVADASTSLEKNVEISIFQTGQKPVFPEVVSTFQTQNAITYDLNSKRYCDYYDQAYTIIDFETNQAQIYGESFEVIHEIVYLLILSRVGKKLDLRGLHKLHAFAVSFQDLAFVCMMPSKGGKSTLLAELLKHPQVKMISDDIPLIDSFGCVHTFALKLGLNKIPDNLKIENREENIYSMKRSLYGEKTLICTRGLEGKVEGSSRVFRNVILAEAFRFNSESSKIIPSPWFKTLKGLFKHGVIGIGSPMVIEYFWQSGLSDFLVKTRIFILRCMAFGALSVRSRRIQIHSGRNPEQTAGEVIKFLEKESSIREINSERR